MEKGDKLARTTVLNKRAPSVRWHMSCRIKWYPGPDTKTHWPRHTHTQNSKTAGQTSEVSAMLVTWKIRWRLWLDERTSTKRIEGTRLCLPLHIMCWRVVGPFSPPLALLLSLTPSPPPCLSLVCVQQVCTAASTIAGECQARSGTYTLPSLSDDIRDLDVETHKQAVLSPIPNKELVTTNQFS